MFKSQFLLGFLFLLFINTSFGEETNKNKQFNYTYFDYNFGSTVELPAYQDIGPSHSPKDVVEFSIPDLQDARKRPKFRLVMFRIPKGLKGGPLVSSATLSEKLSYCNAVYLGAASAKLVKKRTYKGKEITGHMNKSSIPRKGIKESYILKLEDGYEVFVGFFYLDDFTKGDIIIQTVISSLSTASKTQLGTP